MNTLHHNNLRLTARNEGKIKSYESCCDVRAWSHDVRTQDRYLREWMKADMPICTIPASTLSGFLRTMTCKSRRRATPQCHPDCKSKVLLESICTSCHAVKECLQQDENLEKYFVEEDLESSHWPCDKCLEALKSIKMFWKIIIDKIFNINLSKYDTFEPTCEATNSIISVAKVWQAEILQQAFFVKNITPALSKASNLFRHGNSKRECPESCRKSIRSCRIEDNDDRRHVIMSNSRSFTVKPRDSNIADKRAHKKASKCTSIRIPTADIGCDTCFFNIVNEEVKAYSKNIKVLQEKFNVQNEEMERLKKENNSLRIELENVYKSCPWKASFHSTDGLDINHHTVTLIPTPFEVNVEENSQAKNIDSEMIITMKNCKNESFRHVSLLQVLHKTNGPMVQDTNLNSSGCKKEDPIEILNKVQNTFGAIVRREMSIVNERRHRPKKTDVDATFHRINTSKSAPSCSTLSSQLSSDADFVSTKDFFDKNKILLTNVV